VRLQFAAVGLDELAEGLAIAGPDPGEDCPDHRAVILPADRMRAWEQAPSRPDGSSRRLPCSRRRLPPLFASCSPRSACCSAHPDLVPYQARGCHVPNDIDHLGQFAQHAAFAVDFSPPREVPALRARVAHCSSDIDTAAPS